MNDRNQKARETRQRNAAKRAAKEAERKETKQLLQTALQNLLKRDDATPKEILEASKILIELNKI